MSPQSSLEQGPRGAEPQRVWAQGHQGAPVRPHAWPGLGSVVPGQADGSPRAEAGGRKGCQERGMEGEAGAIAPLSFPASYKGTKWMRERMWKTREVEQEPSRG